MPAHSPPAAAAPAAPTAPLAPHARLLQAVITHARDIVCITDAQEAIVYVNEAFTQLTGYTSAEAIGRTPRMLQGPRTDRAALERIRVALAAHRPVREELINYARDGHSYWADVDIVPAANAAGDITHFIAIERDITAQKRAETSTRMAEGMLALLLAGVAAAVLVLDEQGRITMANSAVTRMFGWPVAALLERDFATLIPTAEQDRTLPRLCGHPAPEATDHLAVTIRRQDGTELAADASAVGLRRPDGRLFRVITLLPKDAALLLTAIAPVAADAGPAEPGRLHLVKLDTIRTALGDRWERDSIAVRGRAERIARHRLAPHDVISQVADDGLLICFADLTPAEGEARATAIGREIEQLILGGLDAPGAGIAPAPSPPATSGPVPLPPATIAPMILAQLESSQAALEANWRRIAQHAVRHSAIRLQPVRTSEGRSVPMAMASLPATVAASLGRAGGDAANEGGSNADLLLLSKAAELVVAAVRSGDSPLVIVPVTYATLTQRRTTTEYLEVLQSIREHVRRYLVIDVRAIPEDAPRSRLEDVLASLRNHARGVGISLGGPETRLITQWQTPLQFISIEHSALGTGDRLREEVLGTMARMAQRYRARVLVRDLPTTADAAALRRVGVDLMTTLEAAA